MKVYKIELCFIDFDNLGEEEIKSMLGDLRLPNHIIPPSVMNIEGKDIGEWDDENPLNNSETEQAEYKRIFNL